MRLPRFLTAAAAACSLMLAGCAPLMTGLASGLMGSAPAPQAVQTATAPLANTRVDEQALRVALAGFDTVLYAVDALVSAKVLVKNTPRAKTIAGYLTACKDALNAAFDIATALNNPVQTLSIEAIAEKGAEYRRLLTQAETAFRSARSAISGQSAALDQAMRAFDERLRDVGDDDQITQAEADGMILAFAQIKLVVDTEAQLRAMGLMPRASRA